MYKAEGPVPTPSAPNSPSTPTAPPQNSTPVTPPTSGSSITGSTNGTNTLTTAVTTHPDSLDTGAIVGCVVGAVLLLIIIIIVVIVIVIRCRKCGGREVNSTASGSRHDGSNTAELLNTSATSQSGGVHVAQERDPNPAESTVVHRVSPGTATLREGDDHATGRPDEATVIVMKPYLAEIHADCSTEMKCDDMDGPVLETENTDVCVTVAGVQEHADQDKLKEGPKSQCVFSAGSPAHVHPRGEDTGNCEKLSYKDVLLYQPQPHLLYKAGDCTTRACVVSEPKKIPQADGEFYPSLKNVPSDHMYIDLENNYTDGTFPHFELNDTDVSKYNALNVTLTQSGTVLYLKVPGEPWSDKAIIRCVVSGNASVPAVLHVQGPLPLAPLVIRCLSNDKVQFTLPSTNVPGSWYGIVVSGNRAGPLLSNSTTMNESVFMMEGCCHPCHMNITPFCGSTVGNTMMWILTTPQVLTLHYSHDSGEPVRCSHCTAHMTLVLTLHYSHDSASEERAAAGLLMRAISTISKGSSTCCMFKKPSSQDALSCRPFEGLFSGGQPSVLLQNEVLSLGDEQRTALLKEAGISDEIKLDQQRWLEASNISLASLAGWPGTMVFLPASEMWIKLGGDKGGGTFKMNFQIINFAAPNSVNNTCVFCCFETDDRYTNLHIALERYEEQVEHLQGMTWR
eukprot:Em0602g1a